MIESRFKIGLYVESHMPEITYDTIPTHALLAYIMEQEDPNRLDIEEYRHFTIRFYQTLLENPNEVHLISQTLQAYGIAK